MTRQVYSQKGLLCRSSHEVLVKRRIHDFYVFCIDECKAIILASGTINCCCCCILMSRHILIIYIYIYIYLSGFHKRCLYWVPRRSSPRSHYSPSPPMKLMTSESLPPSSASSVMIMSHRIDLAGLGHRKSVLLTVKPIIAADNLGKIDKLYGTIFCTVSAWTKVAMKETIEGFGCYIEANGMKNEKIESLPASELDHLLSKFVWTHGGKTEKNKSQRQFPVFSPV